MLNLLKRKEIYLLSLLCHNITVRMPAIARYKLESVGSFKLFT